MMSIMIKHIESNTVFPYHPLSYITLKEYLENSDYEVKGSKTEITKALVEELKIQEKINNNG